MWRVTAWSGFSRSALLKRMSDLNQSITEGSLEDKRLSFFRAYQGVRLLEMRQLIGEYRIGIAESQHMCQSVFENCFIDAMVVICRSSIQRTKMTMKRRGRSFNFLPS